MIMKENIDHIVSGILYDFVRDLTTRDKQIVASSGDNAAPMAEAVLDFLELRGVERTAEPFWGWYKMCKNYNSVKPDLFQKLPNGYYVLHNGNTADDVLGYLYDHEDFSGKKRLAIGEQDGGGFLETAELLPGTVLKSVELKDTGFSYYIYDDGEFGND